MTRGPSGWPKRRDIFLLCCWTPSGVPLQQGPLVQQQLDQQPTHTKAVLCFYCPPPSLMIHIGARHARLFYIAILATSLYLSIVQQRNSWRSERRARRGPGAICPGTAGRRRLGIQTDTFTAQHLSNDAVALIGLSRPAMLGYIPPPAQQPKPALYLKLFFFILLL